MKQRLTRLESGAISLVVVSCLLLSSLASAGDGGEPAGDRWRHHSWDQERGHVWVGPGARAKERGDGWHVVRGRMLWTHPTVTTRLTTDLVEVDVVQGGVIGVHAQANAVAVDCYLGRGTVRTSRDTMPLRAGTRLRWSAESGWTRTAAPTLFGTYGAPVLTRSPRATAVWPSGALALLQLPVAGRDTPAVIHPERIELDVEVAGLGASVTAEITLPVQPGRPDTLAQGSSDAPMPSFGLLQILMPRGALLHEATLDVDGKTHRAQKTSQHDMYVPRHPMVVAPPPDAPEVERAVVGIAFENGPPTELRLSLRWTHPLAPTDDGALLWLPWTPNPSTRIHGVVSGPDGGSRGLRVSHGRPPPSAESAWRFELVGAGAPEPVGVLARHPTESVSAVWAGRSHPADGVFFALQPPTTGDTATSRDFVVVVDASGSTADDRRDAHLRELLSALAAHGQASDSRIAIVSFASGSRTHGFAEAASLDRARIDGWLEDAPDGELSRLDRGLSAVAELVAADADTTRPVQVLVIGDGGGLIGDRGAFEEVLEALAARDVSVVVTHDAPVDEPHPLSELAQQWKATTIAHFAGTPGAITASRLIATPLQPLARQPPQHANPERVSLFGPVAWPGGWAGTPSLRIGQLDTRGPLFDVAKPILLCQSIDRRGMCTDEAPSRLVRLADGTPSPHLGHVITAVRTARQPGRAESASDTAVALSILGRDEVLQFPDLRGHFQHLVLERRDRGASDVRWLPPEVFGDVGVHAGQAGRRRWRRDVPSAHGSGQTSGVPRPEIGRDPWLQRPPAADASSPPGMRDVLIGRRVTRGGMSAPVDSSMSVSVRGPRSRGGQIATAIARAKQTGDRALAATRRKIVDTLDDEGQQLQFVRSWHDTSRDSIAQLASVRAVYSALGRTGLATLTGHDITMADPAANHEQRKLAVSYFVAEGHDDRALQHLRRELIRMPRDPFWHEELAVLAKNTGRRDLVDETYLSVLEGQLDSAPDPDGVSFVLDTLAARDRVRPALSRLRRAREHSDSPTACRWEAQLLSHLGRAADATERLHRCVDRFPRSRHARWFLTAALLEEGRLAEARQVLADWHAVDPLNLALHQLSGHLALRAGEPGRAREHFETIVERLPSHPLGYMHVGDAALSAGARETAIDFFELALARSPGNPWVMDRLADVYAAEGRLADAVSIYERLASNSTGLDTVELTHRRERHLQLLLRWLARAHHAGDDARIDDLEDRLRKQPGQHPVAIGIPGGRTSGHAVRIVVLPVPEARNDLLDVRIHEPGGTVLSSIQPSNTALGSQLQLSGGRKSALPRYYVMPPPMRAGTWVTELEHASRSDTRPVEGRIYVHAVLGPFRQRWARRDFALEPGETITFAFDPASPGHSADLVVPAPSQP